MKKLSAILMAMLVLMSAFSMVASAEGEPVNYALQGQYAYNGSSFLASADGTTYYGDDALTILNDGVNPYYMPEEPGLGVVLTGSAFVHVITFDLGATYDDIYELVFGNVWDSVTFGYADGEEGKGNRGFAYEKAIINVSPDGVNYERTKDYEVVLENHTEDGSENGFYDYRFKFNAPVTAKAIQMMIYSPSYCLSLSEIEIWGNGHSIPTPEVSLEESSEEIVEASSEETVVSEAASKEESKADVVSEATSKENSKAESTAETSKDAGDDDKGSALPIVIGVVAAVVVIAVVVVVIKKKK